MSTVRVAVTQHEPVWLDLAATTAKTCKIIKEAAEAGAKLVAFPECWIPGYPAWIWYTQTSVLTWATSISKTHTTNQPSGPAP